MLLMIIFLSIFPILINSYSSSEFNWPTANTSVWLSAAAYCKRDTYTTRNYLGASSGFIATNVIYESKSDTNGYVGYRAQDSSIYVVFRGSNSIKNWLDNLDAVLTSYPRCDGCEVHKGFYSAQKAVFEQVKSAVSKLKSKFPSYKIVVTGHSLGAALATLTSADLIEIYGTVYLYNYGSPRVGNTKFAEWFSNYGKYRDRVTHYKDVVPHVPMHERFTHISGEWYHEDKTGDDLRECTGYEDHNCSYQWNKTNIDDHMNYLGLYLSCESVS